MVIAAVWCAGELGTDSGAATAAWGNICDAYPRLRRLLSACRGLLSGAATAAGLRAITATGLATAGGLRSFLRVSAPKVTMRAPERMAAADFRPRDWPVRSMAAPR